MSISVEVVGEDGQGRVKGAVFTPKNRGSFFVDGEPNGSIVYTIPYREYSTGAALLTNSSGSTEMAIDASIGGTPENVYIDEPTTGWTNSALGGTWDFASTAITPQGGTHCIDATGTTDGDEMQMERSSSISLSSYTTFSGFIYLDSINISRHSIEMEVRLAGVIVGNKVDLKDYIDTGTIGSWQPFIIPKSDLGLNGSTIDQIVFRTISTSGAPPNYYLDTINIEESGGELFSFVPPPGMTFEIFSVAFIIQDNITVLEPGQFMGLSALTNGVVLRTKVGGATFFSAGIKTLFDIYANGSDLESTMFGATETLVNFIGTAAGERSRLKGDNGDSFSFLISDDLSGLTSFKAIVRGAILRS
jgi:hypothetical protein